MFCKHCNKEADLILTGEGFCHEHMNLTAYVGKRRKFEQVKPGQIFAVKGTKYLKIADAITGIRLPDFDIVKFGNYDDVYLLGDLNVV